MKTRIAITADIHFGTLAKYETLEKLVDTLVKNEIDYLVIAGDLTSRGALHPSFAKAFQAFRRFPGSILFSPGNHDLWTKGEDSFKLLKNELPRTLDRLGHRLLDGNPAAINGTGIVGSVGWYDYGFRAVPPEVHEAVTPYWYEFSEGGERRVVRWDEILESDYEWKRSKVSQDRTNWSMSTWQDRYFIHWNFTDRGFLDYCLERLAADIEKVSPEVDDIIVVTHHLPFAEFVPAIPDPTWAFHRAYLGSNRIGELLQSYPKVKYVFSGHVHRQKQMEIGPLLAHTAFFHSSPGMFVVNIEE